MRWLPLPMLLAACASMPGDTLKNDRVFADVIAGRTPGPAEQCIDVSQVNGPQIIDERRIAYSQNGRRTWVNTLPTACPGLRRDATLIVEVYSGRLCQNDRFRTLYAGQRIPGAYCRFGRFTPYDKPRD